MSAAQLALVLECPEHRAEQWWPHLEQAMADFDINTGQRREAFIAQVGVESGRLVSVREIWSPEHCPWQEQYEWRSDLGNEQPGDGRYYLGRGLLPVRGRKLYRHCGKALGLPLETEPQLLEMAKYAALSAAWLWRDWLYCNRLADAGNFTQICRRISRGLEGYGARVMLWERARLVFGQQNSQGARL